MTRTVSDRFNGRTALVTGAAGGIGTGVARRLAREGVNIALLDLNLAGLNATRDEIIDFGGRAADFQDDVTSEEAVEQAVSAAEMEPGLISLAVAGAGIIFNK